MTASVSAPALQRLVYIHPASSRDGTDCVLSSLRAIGAEFATPLEDHAETEDLAAALKARDDEEEVLAFIVAGNLRQPAATARLAHRLVPGAFILLLADSEEEAAIRHQLGIVPMLGSHWRFVMADEDRLRLALREAREALKQRRYARTTIQRVAETLARPRPRLETRVRREMLAESYLRSLLNHGFDAVACFGEELQVLVWNAAAAEVFGIEEPEVAGRTVEDLSGDSSLQPLLELVLQCHSDRQVKRTELHHERTDGSSVDLEVTVTPVRDQIGGTTGIVVIARDVSERLKAQREAVLAREAAEQANRAKDRFLAVLSHELRTPLSPVLPLLDSLTTRDGLSVDIRSDLQLIRRNILLEARLIDDLLDINRISSGKLQLHTEQLDLHRIVQYALDICRPEAVAKNVRFEADLQADIFHVCGDLARMQQIFWNLIQNAVKFTPSGGLVTVQTRIPEEGWIEVSVQDTGVGIPAEILPRIFDPFEQGTTAVTRRFGGLGLGLAICKALVQAHAGTITASSPGANQGTAFAVRFSTKPGSGCGTSSVQEMAPGILRRNLKILLVEDHDDTRGTLQRLLSRRGHSVLAAADVAEALRLAAECNFDLLVTDIGLPDGSGHSLMRDIRAKCPGIAGIALSGFGMEEDIEASLEAGFAEHLTKPVNFQNLEDAIYRRAAEMRAE